MFLLIFEEHYFYCVVAFFCNFFEGAFSMCMLHFLHMFAFFSFFFGGNSCIFVEAVVRLYREVSGGDGETSLAGHYPNFPYTSLYTLWPHCHTLPPPWRPPLPPPPAEGGCTQATTSRTRKASVNYSVVQRSRKISAVGSPVNRADY